MCCSLQDGTIVLSIDCCGKSTSVKLELILLPVVDGCTTRLIHGMTLNPLTLNWSWISNTSVNYALHAVKSIDHSTES